MIKTKKQVRKRQNGHLIQVELEHLKKLAIMVAEMDDLLEGLEAKSIEDFETKINNLTSFTNAMVSSAAFGKEDEYKRLLELEILIDGKLFSRDLTKSKDLKSSVIASVIDKHTEYYSEKEYATKKTLEDLMQTYNSLSLESRQHIAFNRSNELAFNIFSELRF